ncbi:hypothetical protein [Alicyclobacillus ferrooxydans]|uniref:Uncharacterized protein n=1 Tax=Alicyclobacillus ferrooxydans TaxID=471514 RepID=A0A0P9CF89_9BACL|nr:hypothetical protein [Alicyclobacillus ferrooxydans]KPV44463.1 hypothetical protein AN477_07625 [Alicyclobacillus ferrooxydans]
MAQSVREQVEKFVVWYDSGRGWKPSKPMNFKSAEDYAEDLQNRGMSTRIHPQLMITVDDLING